MIQALFLFINASLSIGVSMLLLINISLNLNIKEVLTALACVSSVSNFYTIYQLLQPSQVHSINQSQHYIIDDCDEIYTVLSSTIAEARHTLIEHEDSQLDSVL